MGRIIYSSNLGMVGIDLGYSFTDEDSIQLTSTHVQSVGKYDGDEASHLNQLLKTDNSDLMGD